MVQCAQAAALEVTLAYYCLLEDLLVRSGGVSAFGLRGQPARALFPSAIGSTTGDNVLPESRSLATVFGLTFFMRAKLLLTFVICQSMSTFVPQWRLPKLRTLNLFVLMSWPTRRYCRR